MTADHAIDLLRLLDDNGIAVWVDGGWAVDAVLGRQTRQHDDIDIVVLHADVPRLRALLEHRGFVDVPRDDTWECNFVLGDKIGCQVDVHSVSYNDQGMVTSGVPYPIESLRGRGQIAGYKVRCVHPEWLLRFRTGYPLRAKDHKDVAALCERFGFAKPEPYCSSDGGQHLQPGWQVTR